MDNRNGQNGAPVEVKDLRKAFGDQTVLNGMSLRVDRGETLAVLGRSGTGKSVLLKLIIGLQPPDSGSIQLDGKDITDLPLEKLNEIRRRSEERRVGKECRSRGATRR